MTPLVEALPHNERQQKQRAANECCPDNSDYHCVFFDFFSVCVNVCVCARARSNHWLVVAFFQFQQDVTSFVAKQRK